MAKDKSRDALRAVGDAVEQDKPGARSVGWAAVVQCTAGEQPYPQLLKVSWLPSLHCEHLEGGSRAWIVSDLLDSASCRREGFG